MLQTSRVSSTFGNKIRSIGTREKKHDRFDNDINHLSTTLHAKDTSVSRFRISNTPSSSYGVFFELHPVVKPDGIFLGDFCYETEVASISQKRGSSEKEMLFEKEGIPQRKATESSEVTKTCWTCCGYYLFYVPFVLFYA